MPESTSPVTASVTVPEMLPCKANASVQVMISLPVVTVTSQIPGGASGAMVILAVTRVAESTVVLLMVMPPQPNETMESVSVKLVFNPVMVTSSGLPFITILRINRLNKLKGECSAALSRSTDSKNISSRTAPDIIEVFRSPAVHAAPAGLPL